MIHENVCFEGDGPENSLQDWQIGNHPHFHWKKNSIYIVQKCSTLTECRVNGNITELHMFIFLPAILSVMYRVCEREVITLLHWKWFDNLVSTGLISSCRLLSLYLPLVMFYGQDFCFRISLCLPKIVKCRVNAGLYESRLTENDGDLRTFWV